MTMNTEGAQPPQQPVYAPPQPAYLPPKQSGPKGLALTALIVGIVAFLLGLVPVLGIILGLTGVVFGIIALVKKQSKGLAITGLVLAGIATLASIGTTVGVGAAVDSPSSTTSTESSESKPAEPQTTETAEEAATAPEVKPEPTERLTLDEGWTVATDEYGMFTTVTGYVSNNSDKAITNYVQITFDTLDANGANLGTCLANTNTIDANGKWKFEAACLDDADEIAEVRFKEITGF